MSSQCHSRIDVLIRRDLVVESFREHDYTLFPRWPFLIRSGQDTYRLPEDMPSLPLMYSVRFRRPGGSAMLIDE